jgi:hypothetical protein
LHVFDCCCSPFPPVAVTQDDSAEDVGADAEGLVRAATTEAVEHVGAVALFSSFKSGEKPGE